MTNVKCDADCPQRAVAAVIGRTGAIYLCGHHMARHADTIVRDGLMVVEADAMA